MQVDAGLRPQPISALVPGIALAVVLASTTTLDLAVTPPPAQFTGPLEEIPHAYEVATAVSSLKYLQDEPL